MDYILCTVMFEHLHTTFQMLEISMEELLYYMKFNN